MTWDQFFGIARRSHRVWSRARTELFPKDGVNLDEAAKAALVAEFERGLKALGWVRPEEMKRVREVFRRHAAELNDKAIYWRADGESAVADMFAGRSEAILAATDEAFGETRTEGES